METEELYRPYLRIIILIDAKAYLKDIGVTDPTQDQINKVQNMYPPIIINRYPDEFDISCTIEYSTDSTNGYQNCMIDITNLSAYVKYQMLNKHYAKLKVQAGYLGKDYRYTDNIENTKMSVIFSGSIAWIGTTIQQRKNIITRFIVVSTFSGDTAELYSTSYSVSFNGSYNLYQLLNELVKNNNNPDFYLNKGSVDAVELTSETSDITLENLNSKLDHYSTTVSYDFDSTSMYDNEYYIKLNSSEDIPTKYNTIELNENTGLIGIPTLQSGDNPTVKLECLFNPSLKIYNYVKLNNEDIQLPTQSDYSSASSASYIGSYLDPTGYYKITKITYSLDTRGENFKQELETSPYNIYERITGE